MKFSRRPWFELISIPGIVIASSSLGYGVAYLSIEEAQEAIFPGEVLTPWPLALSSEEQGAIQKKSGVEAGFSKPKIWRTSKGGCFMIDDVIGKHEFITYAVGINPDGSIRQIEIMNYRENYGDEIRDKRWRRQFIGKTASSTLKLNKDIKNISGATLS